MQRPLDSKHKLPSRQITSQFYLTPEQCHNASQNQATIMHEMETIKAALLGKKQTIQNIHDRFNTLSSPLQERLVRFKHRWERYHSSPKQQIPKEKHKLLKQANDALKQLEPMSDEKEYLNEYHSYFEQLGRLDDLQTNLDALDLVHLQAENYREVLGKFKGALGRAQARFRERPQGTGNANLLANAWNHWVDAQGYHRWIKRHEKTQLNLQRMLLALEKQHDFDIAAKTLSVLESECFIIETLTEAYDQIDRLYADHRCCVKSAIHTPQDGEIDLEGFNSGYIRVKNAQNDKLFYVKKDKNNQLLIQEVSQPSQFDAVIVVSKNSRVLSLEEIKQIKRATGHDPANKADMLFQENMANNLRKINQLCNQFKSSGDERLRYIAGVFMLFTAVVVIVAGTALGMYLGGGTAAAIVATALAFVHLSPALLSLATASGWSIALVTPLALGVGGGVAAGVSGLIGFGIWKVGQDKNPVSCGARQASNVFLSDMLPYSMN